MKIAVCDDSREICAEITELIKRRDRRAEISVFSCGEALLGSGENFDIVFLDIEMKKLSGIETAKRLRSLEEGGNRKTVVVFITAFREYMEQAFDVGAFNYITKPIDEERFFRIFDGAVKEADSALGHKFIIVKCQGVQRKFFLHDIYYIESSNKKVVLKTREGDFDVYGKINEFEKLLAESFFRCHRCYLVNMEAICAYGFESVEIVGGDKLPMSKKKYSDFVKAYLRYAREGGIVNV